MSKRTTMEDVARAAGVSRALVSIAFRDAPGVSASTKAHILDTARQLGYRVNTVASNLASRSRRSVGIFLLDLRQEVYADIFDGIREVVEQENLHLVLSVGSEDGSRDASSLEALIASQVAVIIGVGMLLPDEHVQSFNRITPIVSVAREVDGVDSVAADNETGAREATEHLITLGHQRIAFLSNPQTDGYLGRRLGYLAAMEQAGLTPTVVDSTYSRQAATADIREELRNPPDLRPTAVFAHNDQAALGVMDSASELGLTVPDDLSIVGFDNSQFSAAPTTRLTTVDLHGAELGRAAARAALKRLGAPSAPPQLTTSLPTLIVRGSSAPPRMHPGRSLPEGTEQPYASA